MKNILAGIICTCIICFVIYFIYNLIASDIIDTASYDMTVEEVKRIHENSDFLGCTLLSDAPKDTIPQESYEFDKDGKVGYACDSYGGKFVVTRIYLESSDTNVFGIAPNSNYDKVASIMEDEGYVLREKEQLAPMYQAYESYEKHHVFITFQVSEGEQIIDICVGVQDPVTDDIVY